MTRGWSAGGVVSGEPVTVTMQRVEDCRFGFPLFRIDGGPPEHVLDGDMQRQYLLGMLACVDQFRDLHPGP